MVRGRTSRRRSRARVLGERWRVAGRWSEWRPRRRAGHRVPCSPLLLLPPPYLSLPKGTSTPKGSSSAPEEGLWDPKGIVTAEDIRHMRNRFHPFQCSAVIKSMKDMDPCAIHMCCWIVDGANAADAKTALRPPLALPAPEGAASSGNLTGGAVADVAGLTDLASKARLPPETTAALRAELLSAGAVDVSEVTAEDWSGLSAWGLLKQFERRRVLKCIA